MHLLYFSGYLQFLKWFAKFTLLLILRFQVFYILPMLFTGSLLVFKLFCWVLSGISLVLISLIISETTSFNSDWSFWYHFLKGSIKSFASFSILLCNFPVLICRSALYILTMNPLSDITTVFSHYVIYLFSLLVMPSVKQNFFILM